METGLKSAYLAQIHDFQENMQLPSLFRERIVQTDTDETIRRGGNFRRRNRLNHKINNLMSTYMKLHFHKYLHWQRYISK